MGSEKQSKTLIGLLGRRKRIMNTEEFVRLRDAVRASYKELDPFRKELETALRAYAGPHYGNNGGTSRPVNMLELAVESMLQQLSSRAPQVLCTTHRKELQSTAAEMKLVLNEAMKRIGFEHEHRLWVLSAIFCVGIMEVGLHVTKRVAIDDDEMPITELFVEAIMFDDFVYDTTARKWDVDKVAFWGHRNTMSLAKAKANPDFDPEVRKRLTATEKVSGSAAVSTGDKKNDRFRELVDIWQIFVPETSQVVTFAQDTDQPLRVVEWTGPSHGPYHLLGFNEVLNNIMPLPPVANWIDLDELENLLWRKLGNQASRQKTIGVTDTGNVTDGQQIIKTGDGDVIAVGNPNAFKEVSFGGVNQQTLGFALTVKNMTDFVMGNLSAQMGLGATADTLGQEQLIRQAANIRIKSMQDTLLSATEQVLRDIAFYLHSHPTMEFNITQRISGVNIDVPLTWPFRDDGFGNEIDVRRGKPMDLAISIVPYSMTSSTPGQRATMLRQLWAQDILPAVQLGLQPNIAKYFESLAVLLDLPELREIVTEAEVEADPQQQQSPEQVTSVLGKPNGQYTRNNVSRGQTPQAAEQQMTQMLMAADTEQ